MSSIFKPLVSKSKPTRNAFDLSHRSVYSNRVGLLQPVLCLETNPNEHFEIDVNSFVRTQPLNTSAFVRVRQNIDFFFVPYRTIWHNFGNFFSGTDFRTRSFQNYGESIEQIPTLPKDVVNQIYTYATEQGLRDMFGYELTPGAIRLFDMLGYNLALTSKSVDGKLSGVTTFFDSIETSPFRAAAYQKIYQDFFRNPLYETMDFRTYSLDTFDHGTITDQLKLCNLFTLRYATWKRDYFTSIRPSYQGADFINPQANDLDITPFSGNAHGSASLYYNAQNNNFEGYANAVNNHISAQNIRTAFALDKLAKLMERAHDGSYSEQIANRFGVRPREDGDMSVYIGSYDAPVQINEVVSTSDTSLYSDGTKVSGEVLGRIAGKGYVSANGRVSFDAEEHGIIMAIESFVPEADYNSFGLDRANTFLNRFDFFNPELDDLGYQPIYQRELSLFADRTSGTSESIYMPVDKPNSVLGYNVPYANFKTSVDKVHGAFRSKLSLSSWTAPRHFDAEFNSGLNTSFFKVAPWVLDDVFVIQTQGLPSDLLFDNDQFLCSVNFNVKALRPMSVYGLPNV